MRYGAAARRGVDQWTQAPRIWRRWPARRDCRCARWTRAARRSRSSCRSTIRRKRAALHRRAERWTPRAARLILIDDASTDPAIARDARAARAARERVDRTQRAQSRLHAQRQSRHRSSPATPTSCCSTAIPKSVRAGCESLRLAAYGDDAIGTVTAVSDNAGAFSVPELEQYCPTPPRWDLPQAQRAVLQQAGLRFPELPTGNGFCMFVKRARHRSHRRRWMPRRFPPVTARKTTSASARSHAGFRNVIAGNVLVRHERSASFGDARRAALGVQGMAVLRAALSATTRADVGATLYSFDTARARLPRAPHLCRQRRLLCAARAAAAPAGRRVRTTTPRSRRQPTMKCSCCVRRPALRLYRIAADGNRIDIASRCGVRRCRRVRSDWRAGSSPMRSSRLLAPAADAFAAAVAELGRTPGNSRLCGQRHPGEFLSELHRLAAASARHCNGCTRSLVSPPAAPIAELPPCPKSLLRPLRGLIDTRP